MKGYIDELLELVGGEELLERNAVVLEHMARMYGVELDEHAVRDVQTFVAMTVVKSDDPEELIELLLDELEDPGSPRADANLSVSIGAMSFDNQSLRRLGDAIMVRERA